MVARNRQGCACNKWDCVFDVDIPRGLLICGIVVFSCRFLAFIGINITRFGLVFTPSSVRMPTPISLEEAVWYHCNTNGVVRIPG